MNAVSDTLPCNVCDFDALNSIYRIGSDIPQRVNDANQATIWRWSAPAAVAQLRSPRGLLTKASYASFMWRRPSENKYFRAP